MSSCEDGSCRFHMAGESVLASPDTFDHNTPWKFYNHLIEGIPSDIAVTDYCMGVDWGYVEAECGMGVGHTVHGGANHKFNDDPRKYDLKSLAQLSKSWNFEEASLGVAALNAWYSQYDKIVELGGTFDDKGDKKKDREEAFGAMREDYEGKNVTVIGHFPNVVGMAKVANLTVLERSCNSALDTPDPACEYVLPLQDYVFLTGTTITNKTAPRLLELSKNAITTMVGPSTIPSEFLFKWDVNVLAGSAVVDPESAKFAIKGGSKELFERGIKKYILRSQGK
ncbi:MAG: Rossmann-like domain-containing protein [Coriobacteriales bacterium]|jgi:uncharacterized protein (DUF4213/DUF364 family)